MYIRTLVWGEGKICVYATRKCSTHKSGCELESLQLTLTVNSRMQQTLCPITRLQLGDQGSKQSYCVGKREMALYPLLDNTWYW